MHVQPFVFEMFRALLRKSADSLSWELMAITHILSGTSKRDDSPATAADASKWPMFAFKDAHLIKLDSTPSAPMAAPT